MGLNLHMNNIFCRYKSKFIKLKMKVNPDKSDDLLNKQFITSSKLYNQYVFVRKITTTDKENDFDFSSPADLLASVYLEEFKNGKDLIRINSMEEKRKIKFSDKNWEKIILILFLLSFPQSFQASSGMREIWLSISFGNGWKYDWDCYI